MLVTLSAACAIVLLALLGLYFVITQPIGSVAVEPAVRADPRRLEAHVRRLARPGRAFGQPEGLDRVAADLARELRKTGARVSEQAFEVQGDTYRNIVATFGPEDGERIVVGAHYDAADVDHPGAD